MYLKSLIRFPVDIRRARRVLAAKLSPPGLQQRPIVLDLQTHQFLFDCGRHFASLAHFALHSGSPFYVRCSPILLAAIARKIHGREMLAMPGTQWISSADPLPQDSLVLCDYPSDTHVRMMIGRDMDCSIPVMPYPMHPATLPYAQRDSLQRLRSHSGRLGIFFAGNQKPKYGDDKIRRNFGVLPRLEVLRALQETFPHRIRATTKPAGDQRSIVICDSRSESISASHWLASIANHRFFVCCPGACQPTCHHLVESMSVGTIPILEYAHRVTPELQDGVNAVCFRGRSGLIEAIERIDRMSTEDIETISQNAAAFYDEHLCGEKFFTSMRDGELDLSSHQVCLPFHERNLFQPTSSVRQSA